MDRLRALTLNIWHRETHWEKRRALIRRGIEQLKPDVIGLQEVLQLTAGDRVDDQAVQIAEGLGYTTCYGAARDLGPGFHFGNAILSRHPILESEVLPLPGKESGETRSMLYARLDTPAGEVPVFVTHLNWKLHHGSVRIQQVQAMVKMVAARAAIHNSDSSQGSPGAAGKDAPYPPILMGDFNAEPISDEIRYMRGFATLDGESIFFADAWAYGGDGGEGFTFDRRNPYAARSHEPPRRIDYIFVRGPDRSMRGEPLETRVVFDEPENGIWPSDHFGLYTELSV